MTATSNGHRAARVAPGATVAPFELPTRAVDLAHAATLAEWATQPARIMDVTKTVNTAVNRLADFVVEAVAVGDGELGREVDDLAAQIGDLSRRLERAELENATLRREMELIAQCVGSRAPKVAAARSKAKPKSSDAGGLPDFVRTTPAKRKPKAPLIAHKSWSDPEARTSNRTLARSP